ncbi:MOSC and FAD-binding oxidoreductase domain-containing protein [Solirubrobacter soli]|uniref:MOSC and FAD-binding oxidoreductase domain-containing protein n=1 Tax=Solirubrobacter soli TaxID=363832 RepID=UPI0003F90165|nr:MOSC and FAD-binding oxidoreductase domain-containing protein [Solirubrobacter soli]
MKLVSLNVGVPREVAWEGKTVRTAIWKAAVDGPRMVRRLNIDGDDQADRLAHGGEHRAVFVYQLDSYRHWERELGRDDFSYGQFGENFTVDGMGDDEVCVGDRYRVGGALFEVTQPRVTCYRVGIRMNDAAMPALLVSHHRPGFYLRVLEEGVVQAGDAIVKVADGPERMTIADVDALLYLPGKTRERLERALRIPALSEGWKGSFRDLLAAPVQAEPAWPGFAPLRVTEVRRESAGVKSFTFAGRGAVPAPGSYLTVRLRPSDDEPPLLRSYSLSDVDRFRISVKREGAASSFLHDHVGVGDTVDVAAPRGTFVLKPGTRPVVLISAGVGATPVLAMLHALDGARRVWWLHGARNAAEHAFAAEVDALLSALPDAHRLVAYSRPAARDSGYDITGRLGVSALEGVPVDADYYVCGPAAFMQGIGDALIAHGVAGDRIATETFGTSAVHRSGIVDAGSRAPHAPDGEPGTGPAITFARSHLTIPWDARFGNLLDFAEACDVPVGFGCRNGVCHNCESGLLAGEVAYAPDPLEPPPAGRILVCCTTPTSELALDL